jgi:diguanylate cyclase (GGDEF)-like protein/PAS domain S-box-containing protein
MAPEQKAAPRVPGSRPRRVLLGAFLAVVVLAVALSGVGVWGVNQTQQHLNVIDESATLRIRAVDAARFALLAVQRDDRQALIERAPARRAAMVRQVEQDVADLRAALAQCIAAYGGINGNAQMDTLQIAMPNWYASQLIYENDLLLDTPASSAAAQALLQGTFAPQDAYAATTLAALAAAEQHNIARTHLAVRTFTSRLVAVLLVVAGVVLALIIVLGNAVAHLIGRQHARLTLANTQLTELVEEVQSQREEIQDQRDMLMTTLFASERGRIEMDAICSTVQDGLALFDAAGHEVYRNPACQRIVGEDEAPWQIQAEQPFLQLYTLDGIPLPHTRLPLRRALQGEVVAAEMYRLQRDDGTEVVVQIEATPIRDATGAPSGVLGVMRDVTAEYRVTRHGTLLRSLAHVCTSALDEENIAQAAVTLLSRDLGIPNCSILLRDPSRPGYARLAYIQLGADVPPEEALTIRQVATSAPIAPDAPMMSLRVLATGEACFNVAPLPLDSGKDVMTLSMHAMAYLPLCLDGMPFGVLTVGYAPHQLATWETPDQTLLQAVADEIATALHRARLFAEAQQLAYTDPLTGLRNHRAMQQALHAALAQAEPLRVPVSVIMLDVDHFRQFNETHGHDVGDRALQIVAQAIQGSVRTQDIAARYGGEEFCVILPGAEPDEAGGVAERVRAAIAAAHVPARAAHGGLSLTASLGHATCPHHATTPADLLKAADIALYAAKHNGRNQVVAYAEADAISVEQCAA